MRTTHESCYLLGLAYTSCRVKGGRIVRSCTLETLRVTNWSRRLYSSRMAHLGVLGFYSLVSNVYQGKVHFIEVLLIVLVF